jgi:hypothetical protein
MVLAYMQHCWNGPLHSMGFRDARFNIFLDLR